MPGFIPPSSAPHDAGSDIISNLVHWVLFGKRGTTGGGLVDAAKQMAASLDPRHPANLVNIASLLVPGGGKGDSMFPWTEDYSLPKAMAGGHVAFREGQPYTIHGALSSAKTNELLSREPGYGLTPAQKLLAAQNKTQALQTLHDALFGGTTHVAPGFQVPPRP